jgi:hypothetical protein
MVAARTTLAFTSAGVVAVAALAILAIPSSVTFIAGLPDATPLAPPDAVFAPAHETPMALLMERDNVALTVPAPVRLDRFIEQNRLRRQRQQIRAQLRLPAEVGDDRFTIPPGTTFHLRLTPEAPDVPGVKPVSGGGVP